MNIIIATLIIILLYSIFTTWLDNIGWKHKEELIEKILDRKEEFIDKAIEKTIDKVSKTVTSGIDMVMDRHKAGPWYLVVYTHDSNYPIWISNNTIQSVHPEPWHNKIIIKQFNGEDMVIENVENYEMCAANDLCDYEM